MFKTTLFQDAIPLCGIQRIATTNGDELFFPIGQGRQMAKGDTFQMITEREPSIGTSVKHYVVFETSDHKHHVEIISVDKMPNAWLSCAVYLHGE